MFIEVDLPRPKGLHDRQQIDPVRFAPNTLEDLNRDRSCDIAVAPIARADRGRPVASFILPVHRAFIVLES